MTLTTMALVGRRRRRRLPGGSACLWRSAPSLRARSRGWGCCAVGYHRLDTHLQPDRLGKCALDVFRVAALAEGRGQPAGGESELQGGGVQVHDLGVFGDQSPRGAFDTGERGQDLGPTPADMIGCQFARTGSRLRLRTCRGRGRRVAPTVRRLGRAGGSSGRLRDRCSGFGVSGSSCRLPGRRGWGR